MMADRKSATQTVPPPYDRTSASLSPIGPLRLETDAGPLDLDEVPGITTNLVALPDGQTGIVVVVYDIRANTGGDAGRGLMVQVTPESARNVAASLLRMAGDADQKGIN